MKKNNKNNFILSLALFLIFCVSGLILFQNRAEALELNLGVSKALQNYVKWRCETIPEKIENKKEKLKERKEKHLNAFNNLRDKLSVLIAKLDDKGYDTGELKDDLSELNDKIEKFTEDFALLMSRLDESKEYVCKKTDAEFKGKLTNSRELLAAVKSDVKDIKNFYKFEIKSHIQELKYKKP